MERYLVGNTVVRGIEIREVEYDRAVCLVPQMVGILNQKLCALQRVGVWDYVKVDIEKGVDVGAVA